MINPSELSITELIDELIEVAQAHVHYVVIGQGGKPKHRRAIQRRNRLRTALLERFATKKSWDRLRELVWERDRPHCQVCGVEIPKSLYDCGHIVDRIYGGLNQLNNLVVMCRYCNIRKPLHQSKTEYLDWLKSGYWVAEDLFNIKNDMLPRWRKVEPDLKDWDDDFILETLRWTQMEKMGLIEQFPNAEERKEAHANGTYSEWKKNA